MHIMIGARHSEINSLAKEHNTLSPATTLPLYLFENKTTTTTTKKLKEVQWSTEYKRIILWNITTYFPLYSNISMYILNTVL